MPANRVPGPRISPLEALSRVAEAAVIVMLQGRSGSYLTWHDQPIADLQELPSHILNEHERTSLLLDENAGLSWGQLPSQASFIQCDYEYPQRSAIIVPATHVAHWDVAGRCTLIGPDSTTLQRMVQQLEVPTSPIAPPRFAQPLQPAYSAATHEQHLGRIKQFIAAGDCYQVNLAVPFHGHFIPEPHRDIAAFQALMQHSPSNFSAFFRYPNRPSVVSHSPECLLAARGPHLISVPIKGTRRIAGDAHRAWADLIATAKDGAELAMIIDLVRNDLGKISVPGSVTVTDHAQRIELPYVIHRAARIVATLNPHHHYSDALRALFPAGSITGAPKHRVMDIIAQLEGQPRGPYCGTFGWIGHNSADLAVAIRTAAISHNQVTLHAGGGIVWDSQAAAEWDEVRAKASAMATAWGGSV